MSTSRSEGLVVIGSGPAGISAALAYREAGGEGPVRVVTSDVDFPYERPPLSKDLLRGESLSRDDLQMHAAGVFAAAEIDLRPGEAVRCFDAAGGSVTTTQDTIRFASCVVASGVRPQVPSMPGVNRPGVHTLRSLASARQLAAAADRARRVVVVGSGFIGCEAAASLRHRGLEVTMICAEDVPQERRLGPWVGRRLADWLAADGVDLVANRRLARISVGDGRLVVHTNTDASIAADVVLLATGVTPELDWLDGSELERERDRIRVDAGMRTSAPDVYAAGDVAFAYNIRAQRHLAVEHWGDALTMGAIAGANAAGREHEWESAPGFWSTIGARTVKYAAWGDGFDAVAVEEHDDRAFTVRYGRGGRTVGVLTHRADDDYADGLSRVAQGDPFVTARSTAG